MVIIQRSGRRLEVSMESVGSAIVGAGSSVGVVELAPHEVDALDAASA